MGKVGTGRQRCPLHAHPFIQSCNGAKCNAVSALTETDRMGLDVHAHAVAVRGVPWLLLHPPVVPCFHPNLQSAWLQVAESPGATLPCSLGRFLCDLTSAKDKQIECEYKQQQQPDETSKCSSRKKTQKGTQR